MPWLLVNGILSSSCYTLQNYIRDQSKVSLQRCKLGYGISMLHMFFLNFRWYSKEKHILESFLSFPKRYVFNDYPFCLPVDPVDGRGTILHITHFIQHWYYILYQQLVSEKVKTQTLTQLCYYVMTIFFALHFSTHKPIIGLQLLLKCTIHLTL